ncbi:VanW family protein [Sporosarcina sp. 179-K 8C2 HS]|uniref:VanW family protein n=1 Tax=Sporosarcina sp. 179-K 8C2 HS TaxID=3142387 RepID=UPI0039A044FF
MRKSNIILIIFTIVLSSAFAKNTFAGEGLFNNKRFTDHTYVGPFNISNNKAKQAKSKLASDLSELQTNLEVNLIYQDIQFSLTPETIKFDIDMTLANANSGEDNPIIANVSREGLATILNQELSWIQFPEDAVDSVAAGIEKELQSGIMPRNVHITDYLGTNVIPDEVVGSSEYSIDGISPALSKAIHALNQTVIGPFETFSLMELLTGPEVGPLSDEEMTLLSSILYSAILQTNFHIDERNISSVVSPNIQPGFEAAMNQTLGLDFKFTNPNKTVFTIRAAWSSGAISLVIEGKPFYYTYEPAITNIETYEPRIIRQYSAFVHEGQVFVSQEGKHGVEAIVKRTLSVDGQVVETENVSEDFYAPVHRIEIHPLSKSDSVPNNSTTEESDTTQNFGTHTETEIETPGPEGVESDNSGSNEVSDKNGELEEEVIYDKSGLPIGK